MCVIIECQLLFMTPKSPHYEQYYRHNLFVHSVNYIPACVKIDMVLNHKQRANADPQLAFFLYGNNVTFIAEVSFVMTKSS